MDMVLQTGLLIVILRYVLSTLTACIFPLLTSLFLSHISMHSLRSTRLTLCWAQIIFGPGTPMRHGPRSKEWSQNCDISKHGLTNGRGKPDVAFCGWRYQNCASSSRMSFLDLALWCGGVALLNVKRIL